MSAEHFHRERAMHFLFLAAYIFAVPQDHGLLAALEWPILPVVVGVTVAASAYGAFRASQ